jgi:hypothetical protein
MITHGNVMNDNGQTVDEGSLGSLGNFIYGKNITPGMAFVLEREVANMKPYRADTFNVPFNYFHAKQLPAAGLTQRISFFDGSVNNAGNPIMQTNWPGPNGLPSNTGFALKRISANIIPIFNCEANPPAYASTAAAMHPTNSPLVNALQLKRFYESAFWEFLVNNRLIASGLGLTDLPVPGAARVQGVHSNTTATTLASSLDTTNGGAAEDSSIYDVPLAIFPGDRVEFRVTPSVPNITFLDAAAAAAISTMCIKLHGKKIEDR